MIHRIFVNLIIRKYSIWLPSGLRTALQLRGATDFYARINSRMEQGKSVRTKELWIYDTEVIFTVR